MESNKPIVKQWARTQSKLHKVSFEWTINNFSLRPKLIQSPTFFADTCEDVKWCLRIDPKETPNDSRSPFFTSIYLGLLSAPSDDSKVFGNFTITVLNSDSEYKQNRRKQAHCFSSINKSDDSLLLLRAVLMDKDKGFLPDDVLTILCEINFLADTINISSLEASKISERKLADDIGYLLYNDIFSDVTLVVGKHEIPAHMIILAARSDVFKAMFEHDMKESKSRRVNIDDVDHEVLQEMLQFIYTGNAPKLNEMASDLLFVADKYALEKLKAMAEKALFAEISVETAADIFTLADRHNADQLKEQTLQFIKINFADIYRTNGWKNFEMNPVYNDLKIKMLQGLLMKN